MDGRGSGRRATPRWRGDRARLSRELLGALLSLAGLTLIVASTRMLLWLVLSRLLVRLLRYDGATAVFATAPGGLGEVVAAAGGSANTTVVAFAQLVRLGSITAFVPSLLFLLIPGGDLAL